MFDSFISYLENNTSSFPFIVVIILFVAFIAMLVVIVVTLVAIKRERSTISQLMELPPSAVIPDEIKPKPEQISTKRNNSIIWWVSDRINRFLINRNLIQVDEVVRSFIKASGYLAETLGVKDKYSLPCFAVIGITGSGKSSLLRGFTYDNLPDEEPISWWFLKNGIVLDIKGNVFMPDGDPDKWMTVLHLLYRYRGKRPLNGIILTIPATELYGKSKLSIEDIKQRARYIARKIAFLQHYLCLRLPVYIVVTKTDVIPGFQSFCAELPTRNRGNMFGWSSPFTIDTIYTSNILNTAFDELENQLNNIRLEILAENLTSSIKDGVFVFPSELLSIRENLCCYIDMIFTASTGFNNAYFRGFYFTGDSKMIPITQLSTLDSGENNDAMAIMGTPDADINEAGSVSATFQNENSVPKKIFFFEDLLLKKIFAETGIASPIQEKVHKVHKVILVAKIATAVFVVVGSYGLFNAKDQLNRSKNDLYPTLCKLSSIIQNSNHLNINTLDARGNEILTVCSTQLLSLMQQLNSVSLYSCFVPASWFSSLSYKLRNTLKNSYQRVIIRTIYIKLLLKIKYMLHIPSNKQTPTLSEALNPHTSYVYKQLNEYMLELMELEQHVKKFDSLRNSGDPTDLNDLIEYTFNGSLQSQFLGSYNDFRNILIDTPFPPLDLSPHKQTIYNTFCKLFNDFINVIFNPKNNFISQINEFITKLCHQTIRQYPECKEIYKFAKNLDSACKSLGKEGETWLDEFNPKNTYQSLLKNTAIMFGKSAVDPILKAFTSGYKSIREQLSNLNKKLQNGAEQQVDLHITTPIFRLSRAMNNWISTAFMSEPQDYELATEIPNGKMVYWDDELIKYAIAISQSFDDFIATKVNEFPKSIQEGVSLVSRANLYAVVAGVIGKAQSFVDEPMGLTKQLTSEEILQRQVGELKDVAPKFQKLLGTLREEKPNFAFTNLRTILNKIGFNLLNHINSLLEDQQPYMPINLTFDSWDGKQGASFHAYATSDTEDLRTYVQLQRNLMTRLAIDFAKPVVEFLNSPYIYDKNYGHHSYLTHWMRIVDNAEGFMKKDPHNSMKTLEKFILKTLNYYTIDNISEQITLDEIKANTGDYFLEIMRIIKKKLYMRSEVLLRQRNIVRYERLRNHYTRYLERFYPFKDFDNKQRIGQDADINAVREFYKLYKEYGNSPEAILDQIYQLDDGKEAYNFLKKVQSIKDLLGDNITNSFETIKIKIDTNFNINKRNEANTDYLVDRIFHPNHDADVEAINPDKISNWYFGEPVSIDFRYAENDDDAPRPDFNESDPDYSVELNLARFECSGNWSLLRFLQKYHVSNLNTNLSDPNQIALLFKIPLNNNKVTRAYIGLTIYKPQNSESEPLVSIKMPSIPGAMPKLPQSIIDVRNKPILTETALSSVADFATPKVYLNAEAKPKDNKMTTKTTTTVTKKNIAKNKTKSDVKSNSRNNKNMADEIANRFVKKSEEEDVIIEEPISQQVDNILNSDETPILNEYDKLIAVSEQPIG